MQFQVALHLYVAALNETKCSALLKSKLQLPPPKNIDKDNNSSPKRKAEDDPTSEEKDVKENDDETRKGITKKVMKTLSKAVIIVY